ncbi:PP2C family protein-serine/threonine phosphatase [Leucobacter denitrificans]|uniref:Serine/threonine-protein phosphatase n=1 Tax=Leucobacter denitrificans TaxID=683042 RepID=A0A7G9S3A6_9MICO|nr:protein phosphatase 2C domain-containing protein [Leucobacter denitrificans]QNN62331.1 serine/threonine-protein phosphatase [Leucobacter denitrificans]
MMQGVQLEAAVVSDVGRKRQVNEDTALALSPAFIVADGMGGHEAGDLASQAAVAAFSERIAPGRPSTVVEVSEALDASRIAVAHVAEGRAHGAGCTFTGAVLVENEGELNWLVVNIGDSRVYLHRGAELQQVTVDHSLRDEVGPAADGTRVPRNVITRALGSADTTADSWLLPVETGARLLICSDGLTTEIDGEELRATLTMGGRAESVAAELVRRANEAGGRDNITVVVVDILAGGLAWHLGPERSTIGETYDDDTLTATVPRRRPPVLGGATS